MCNEHCLDRWINGWVIELGRQDRAWQAGQAFAVVNMLCFIGQNGGHSHVL